MTIFQSAVISLVFYKITPLKFSFSPPPMYVLHRFPSPPWELWKLWKKKNRCAWLKYLLNLNKFSNSRDILAMPIYLLKFKLILIHNLQKVEAWPVSFNR